MAAPLTYQTMMAASRDAGNASMRSGGRSSWNLDDWDAAAAVCAKLTPYIVACDLRCSVAQAREMLNGS